MYHAHRIHQNFGRRLVHAPLKYGGLEGFNSYDIAGLSKMESLMKHLGKDDKTGKLFRISMENTQLQMILIGANVLGYVFWSY